MANIRKHIFFIVALLACAGTWYYFETRPHTRVEVIASWISTNEPKPAVFAPEIQNKAFWGKTPALKEMGPPKSLPENIDGLMSIIASGTNQECKFGTGAWLATINEAMTRVLPMPWSDTSMFTWEFADLAATHKAAALSRTCNLLADKLDPSVLAAATEAIRKKIIRPFLKDSDEYQRRPLSWGGDMCPWLETKNNWNAVCLANIIYATLAIEPDPVVRAKVIANSEGPIGDYFDTFESDGYLGSGIRYWNYGFAHIIILAERLLKATGGKIDLFKTPGISEMARFRDRWEIGTHGNDAFYPLFADNNNPTDIRNSLRHITARRFGTSPAPLPLSVWEEPAAFTDLLLNPPAAPTLPPYKPENQYRTYFPSSGALLAKNPKDSITLAIKGGSNNEEHNHNDVGAYTVFFGNDIVCGDIGCLDYTPKIFSGARYTFDSYNSYGHPLPVINNQLQNNSPKARAKVINESFSPEQDTITYDISGAYAVPGLRKAERSVTYQRNDKTLITVTDSFESAIPISFETAIIVPSGGGISNGKIIASVDTGVFEIASSASGVSTITTYTFKHRRKKVSRFAIALSEKATSGYISYSISQQANYITTP